MNKCQLSLGESDFLLQILQNKLKNPEKFKNLKKTL